MTATTTRKTKTTYPYVTVHNIVPAKKPVTTRSTTTDSKSTDKRYAKANVQPASITSRPPDKKIRTRKQADLIAKLRVTPGITINGMMALSGWQAHTVRGTISGVLRKKLGLNVVCVLSTKTGERLYRIVNPEVIV